MKQTGSASGDGGVDVVLTRDGMTTLVQCKQWRAREVGVGPVRELLGVMTKEGAQRGIVVTSGYFTNDAVKFAEGSAVELVSGRDLAQLIRSAQSSRAAPISCHRVKGSS